MYSENLMIKIPKELKDEAKKKAEQEYKTVSDYIRGLIIRDLQNK